eukprot:Hpha_TRINITY_DN18084_c0_g1::TRINITY_DN18084_c0_g1_i1::g.1187::m.1187
MWVPLLRVDYVALWVLTAVWARWEWSSRPAGVVHALVAGVVLEQLKGPLEGLCEWIYGEEWVTSFEDEHWVFPTAAAAATVGALSARPRHGIWRVSLMWFCWLAGMHAGAALVAGHDGETQARLWTFLAAAAAVSQQDPRARVPLIADATLALPEGAAASLSRALGAAPLAVALSIVWVDAVRALEGRDAWTDTGWLDGEVLGGGLSLPTTVSL